ncbi:entericidin A/B family lipoprotein [Fodinicurvata sp. EGI_FJ10296]|uniref:entericidin A/B family lipoprotein n=1 Tax=Fodinicurvata sp. EGI_FJ10296 TaxID=3231908 RepID=UPI0034516B3B
MTRSLTRSRAQSAMAVAAILIGSFALSACETMQGFGRDVQSGGEAVEDSSEDVQRDMN